MILPLPKGRDGEARKVPAITGRTAAHAGLVFTKFVDLWDRHGEEFGLFSENQPAKTVWINRFAGKDLGDRENLSRACERLKRLALARSGAGAPQPLVCTATTRFVTGMGYEHGLENGFLWHHTLGVPYLPASGIKGMIRAWADHWEALDNDNGPATKAWYDEIVRLFGNYPALSDTEARNLSEFAPDHQDPSMGALIVFDALPRHPVKLAAEVLTPHDGKWRLLGATRGLSPGDWHDPVPVPYLVVEAGAEFLFALGLTRNGTPEDLVAAYRLLEQALRWIGAGAKTSNGYGRFLTKDGLEKQRQEDDALHGADMVKSIPFQAGVHVRITEDWTETRNRKRRQWIGQDATIVRYQDGKWLMVKGRVPDITGLTGQIAVEEEFLELLSSVEET